MSSPTLESRIAALELKFDNLLTSDKKFNTVKTVKTVKTNGFRLFCAHNRSNIVHLLSNELNSKPTLPLISKRLASIWKELNPNDILDWKIKADHINSSSPTP